MTVKNNEKTITSNCHRVELSWRIYDSSKLQKINHFRLSQLSPPKGGM